ncbi:MAG: hypothetical protein U0414_12520 [Polyangiaceae bacterium]
MNTIELTQPRATSPRRDARNLQQTNPRELELRETGKRVKADEDELYENVPCTD